MLKKGGKGTKQRQDVTSDRKYNQWLEDGMRRAEEYKEMRMLSETKYPLLQSNGK